jgi:flagellar basal body P-ring formation protein FlgA
MRKFLPFSLAFLLSGMVQSTMAQEAQLMPVPVRSIFPGESLDDSDFTLKLFNVTDALRKSYAFERNQFIRMEAVRTLVVGKPVLLRSIRTAEDVRKGQPTKAIYTSATVEIQGNLVPLTGGSAGETIEARNPASGSIVRAVVKEDGTLLVLTK